jgi:hypothetical protein
MTATLKRTFKSAEIAVVLVFPFEDYLHQITWIGFIIRQRPVQPFGSRKLTGRASFT